MVNRHPGEDRGRKTDLGWNDPDEDPGVGNQGSIQASREHVREIPRDQLGTEPAGRKLVKFCAISTGTLSMGSREPIVPSGVKGRDDGRDRTRALDIDAGVEEIHEAVRDVADGA